MISSMAIQTITKNILSLIYPVHCAGCRKSLDPLNESGLCDFCKLQIRRNPKPHCPSCGRSIQDMTDLCAECRRRKFHFERAYSACLYEGVLKELVHLFKYKGRASLAITLSGLMTDFIKDNTGTIDEIDLITFVPLQNSRLRRRGFNQSRMLAFNISKEFGIALRDTLEKKGRTKPQNELSREDRLMNLNGSFRVRKGSSSLADLKILLIDDVMTTGSTLNECAKTLLEDGAKEVRCLTLARGI